MVLSSKVRTQVISAFALVLFLFTSSLGFAQGHGHDHADHATVDHAEEGHDAHAEGEHHAEKLDVGKLIVEHVLDQHEIHIGPLHVPLPIILIDEGLTVFSSSRFHDADHLPIVFEGKHDHYYVYDGYGMFHEHIYKLDNGVLVQDATGAITNAKPLDFSITKNVVGILFGVLIMLLVFITSAKHYKKHGIAAPKKGIVRVIEPLVLFLRDDVIRPSIGKKADRYLPFLLTLFFFIWFGNMLGLIPFLGGMNFTGNISVTLVLAAMVFLITSFSANKAYWGHVFAPPGVPYGLYPLLVPIEIIGVISKPVVLMLRLFANITAGHIIILSFTCLIFIFQEMNDGAAWGVSVVSVLFSVFMNLLEILVAFLQAYVFVLLASLYFGSAVEEAHH